MSKPTFKRNACYLIAAAVGTIISSTSLAEESFALEEVVVTAQKRAESLQDVPISVSAMSGDKLSESAIPTFDAVAPYIPNFNIQRNPIGDIVSIRGIQAGIMAGFEQPIGTFVDGVYRGRGMQSRFAFLDVGMVEVLRGPQSTLFGKNTIGGALNLTSATPTDEFEGSISAMYEPKAAESIITGYVSGALTETLRGRFAFQKNDMNEGWVDSVYYNRGHEIDEWAARASLEWELSPDTLVKFKYEGGDWENPGQPLEGIAISPFTALTAPPVPFGVAGDNKSSIGNSSPEIDFGQSSVLNGDSSESALQVDHTLNNGSTITAIVAYNEYESDRHLDADYGPIDGIGFEDFENYDQTSVELRIASDNGTGFEYIAGFYWQEANLLAEGLSSFNVGADADGDSLAPLIAALAPIPLNDLSRYAVLDQESETFAAFAQGTWDLTDSVSFTLGGRYGEETKDASQSVHCTEFGATALNPVCEIVNPNPATNLEAFVVQSLAEFQPHDHTGLSIDEEDWTYGANIQWDITNDVMVYFNMSNGVKSGGFNSFSMSANAAEVAYEPEKIKAFEIGSKMSLLDGTAELNVAVFDMEYTNMQAAIFTGNTAFAVQNAGKSSISGLEIDGRWRMTESLSLTGSFGYTDFEFDEYPNAGCTNDQKQSLKAGTPLPGVSANSITGSCQHDLKGGTNIATPEYSAALSLEHEKELGDLYLRTSVDVNWTDEQELSGDNDPFLREDAYTTLNLTVTLGSSDDVWAISLIGRNITDEEYRTWGNDTPLLDFGYEAAVGREANYAIRGTYNF